MNDPHTAASPLRLSALERLLATLLGLAFVGVAALVACAAWLWLASVLGGLPF